MKSLVNIFVQYFTNDEDFRRKLVSYDRFLATEDGKFFISMLAIMKGLIANDMLGAEYTQKKAEEKDVQQRAYYHISQVLSFLSAPRKYIEKKAFWRLSGLPNPIGRSSDKPRK